MQSKTRLLTEIHTILKRRYRIKPDQDESRLPVLAAVVYGICHEDTTREQANQALARFSDQFLNWNEVRVSSVQEIVETLAGIPQPEEKARRIRRFLRQLFSRTYGFNLDPLTKKPLKEALKVLRAYDAFQSDFVTATVIQQALGGHAIPIDETVARVLHRLGLEETDIPSLRAAVERAVPKNRGVEFRALLEELAHDVCLPGKPNCPHCDLRRTCDYAQEKKAPAKAKPPEAEAKPPAKPKTADKPAPAKPAVKTKSAQPKAGAKTPPTPTKAAKLKPRPIEQQAKQTEPPAKKNPTSTKKPPGKTDKRK